MSSESSDLQYKVRLISDIYISFVVITTQSVLHSWLITGFVTSVTRRIPQEEQELLIH